VERRGGTGRHGARASAWLGESFSANSLRKSSELLRTSFTPVQRRSGLLWQCHKLHCDLYNAALQERTDAYRLAAKSIAECSVAWSASSASAT
jgi:ribosomal protein L37AE/L43A